MQKFLLDERYLDPETRAFYREMLTSLGRSEIPFLVGGAFALGCYTDIVRDTKDFDIFVLPEDAKRILKRLEQAGYQTEFTDPLWIAKAFHGDNVVDVIFSSGNGIGQVDQEWFDHACEGDLLDMKAQLIPPEEMIWSKAFVMTRDRYDGADVAHLLLGFVERLDWQRLLRRFNVHWRVLFNHLVLFAYIYPSERARIPLWVMEDLTGRLHDETSQPAPTERVCQGPFLSMVDYTIDVEKWGFRDPRPVKPTFRPPGPPKK
ncbi:MAG: hypothetical protein BWZ01_02246 [Deltaproteobacteria bacterium ADurb.BinA179]|jgi:hypothetical protein|nr:nucleotidyltransferase [Deltaproteobacteria bacterium]MDI9541731.1 hypothetical protein [Pseudomonadota bacterium]NLW67659.1 nucleotidyltransferase family protein [Bacteriovoracaceae bacterium]OPZ26052.1 MAG: hypothetical protein BWZ01_02246 [Deltaproteobacteria bacterium ADurb.BinA179]HNU74591.1 hypothetical protein [Deltaproteobacteria bacterium]